jgi:hypothetical protein
MDKREWTLEYLNQLAAAMETMKQLGVYSASTHDGTMHVPLERVIETMRLTGAQAVVSRFNGMEYQYKVEITVGDVTVMTLLKPEQMHLVGLTAPEYPAPVPLQAS